MNTATSTTIKVKFQEQQKNSFLLFIFSMDKFTFLQCILLFNCLLTQFLIVSLCFVFNQQVCLNAVYFVSLITVSSSKQLFIF